MARPASAEHAAWPASLRYEIKMACQEAAYERVVLRLQLDPSGIRVLFPPRRVQSIYLDTTHGRALEENLAGISHREKVRLRWYGRDTTRVSCTLERKVRHNMLGWKDTLQLGAPLDVEGVDRVSFMRSLKERATTEWRHALDAGLEPVQWIAYDRDYFATADGRVRITVDRRLRAVDLRPSFVLTSRFETRLPRLLVIEAKCTPEDYPAAQDVLARLPLFVDRCSKFVLASDHLHGPDPSVFP